MGLAKAVAVRFPDWGPDFVFLMVSRLSSPSVPGAFCSSQRLSSAFQSLTLTFDGPLQMSVIMMNLFAGPPIFRSALIAVGEARALQLPSVYSDVKSPQYALCNTSVTTLPSTLSPGVYI